MGRSPLNEPEHEAMNRGLGYRTLGISVRMAPCGSLGYE